MSLAPLLFDLLYPRVSRSALSFYLIRPTYHRQEICNQQINENQNITKEGFHVSLDVKHFTPNEISVKTIDDNTVIVEGKHEKKENGYNQIYRHFVRQYTLPKEFNIKDITSTLSSDGVLTIKAPLPVKAVENKERVVQIKQTGPENNSVKESSIENTGERIPKE